MSDLGDSTHYKVTQASRVPEPEMIPSCGTPWLWIILFITALLVIAGLIVWIVYAYHRDTKDRIIEFKGANIEISSETSLTGTWPTTGKDTDKVTLWATLHPPKFNNDGTLANTNGKSSTTVSGATTVTLSGLQPGIKYYSTIIVTNSNTSNYQVYTQLVYMDSKTPIIVTTGTDTTTKSSNFAIEDILQVGKVQLTGDDKTQIQFNQKPLEENTLWFMNSGGQIESNAENSKCLFNSNGVLVADDCGKTTTDAKINSHWSYNPGKYANRWCLTSTTSNTNPTCMILNPISSGTATIKVADTSSVGDAWVNAFETTPITV